MKEHLRRSTCKGATVKEHLRRSNCEGALWLKLQSGSWSIQQPHALTALRTVLATFNLVAIGLGDHLGVDVRPRLSSPNSITFASAP